MRNRPGSRPRWSRRLREGRITPAEREGCLKLSQRLDGAGRDILLDEVISRREPLLFREFAAPVEKTSTDQLLRNRARFEGFPEDPEHDAALNLMASEPELGFAEALARVRSEGADVLRLCKIIYWGLRVIQDSPNAYCPSRRGEPRVRP